METALNELLEKFDQGIGQSRGLGRALLCSAAAGDHHEGFADLNVFMCAGSGDTPATSSNPSRSSAGGAKKTIPAPLLLSEHEVQTSTDCFAIEFHDIKSHHRILQGKDVISGLVIDNSFYTALRWSTSYAPRCGCARRRRAGGIR